MASVDGLPSLVNEFRGLKSRMAEAERLVYGRAAMAAHVWTEGATTIVLPSGSAQHVTFDAAVFDPQEMWNGTDTLTLPREGVWLLVGKAQFNPNSASGLRLIQALGLFVTTDARIEIDGVQFQTLTDTIVGYGAAGTQCKLSIMQQSGVDEDVENCSLAAAYLGAINL